MVQVQVQVQVVHPPQVHGDVFRAAAHPMLFSSLVGTGAQLVVVVLATVIFAILGKARRGAGAGATGSAAGAAAANAAAGAAGSALHRHPRHPGELYTERGSLLSTTIFVYAATAPVSGYFGGSLYARMGGKVGGAMERLKRGKMQFWI